MIPSSDLPMTVLSKRLGVTVQTIARWKHRNSLKDRPHTPHHPQTTLSANQVERFHGRIGDVLRTHHFHSGETLEATLFRFVWLHNHHLPQKALDRFRSIQAMKKWQVSDPERFHKSVANHSGRGNVVDGFFDVLRWRI